MTQRQAAEQDIPSAAPDKACTDAALQAFRYEAGLKAAAVAVEEQQVEQCDLAGAQRNVGGLQLVDRAVVEQHVVGATLAAAAL